MNKKTIEQLELKGKIVLMRVDFNVPINAKGKIGSDKRIIEALPSIQKVIIEGGKLVLFSHLGRVKDEASKLKNDMAPIAQALATKLKKKVKFVNETRGSILENQIKEMKNGEVIMVQNTRWEDLNDNAESKNSKELGKYWASLGDVFINDAFGTAHRAHASNVGIASNIKESAIGYLIEKELRMLGQGVDEPTAPFVAIIGGAKVSDKIGVIDNLLKKADKILIGGGMAYTFDVARGYKVGTSLVEKDYVEVAKEYLAKSNGKIELPVDHAVSKEFKDGQRMIIPGNDIPDGFMGLDIGPKTIKSYKHILSTAKTVVWNGPMGVFEFKHFKEGTEEVAKAIAANKTVFSIIGGGDSAAAAINLGFEKDFTHISTGGGASLEYMEGKPLPGIEIIQNA